MKGGRFLALLILTMTAIPSICFALDPNKALSQYVYDTWDIDDGLPILSVRGIAQTHDGYLWLGTGNGLVRFDGIRFVVFNDINTKGFDDRNIIVLKTDKEGNLRMGTWGGLCRLSKGKFTTYSSKDGLADNQVHDLIADAAGNLWVGTRGGLSRFRKGRFTTYTTKDGLVHNIVYALCEDRQRNLWIGTTGGLSRFNDGKFTVYTVNDGLSGNRVRVVRQDREGVLWIGTLSSKTGLSRFLPINAVRAKTAFRLIRVR